MTEWFSEPRPNLIEGESLISVEVLGRTGIRYVEGERSALVDSEVLAEPDAIVAYRNSIKGWNAPHESDALDDVDRERMLNNIRRALEFRGYKVHVI